MRIGNAHQPAALKPIPTPHLFLPSRLQDVEWSHSPHVFDIWELLGKSQRAAQLSFLPSRAEMDMMRRVLA